MVLAFLDTLQLMFGDLILKLGLTNILSIPHNAKHVRKHPHALLIHRLCQQVWGTELCTHG